MIKHSAMLQKINTGEPFNCTYCKANGELTEFVGLRKPVKDEEPTPAPGTPPPDRRRRRAAQGNQMLVPFQTANGEIREIYTRLILKFNDEEVVL